MTVDCLAMSVSRMRGADSRLASAGSVPDKTVGFR